MSTPAEALEQATQSAAIDELERLRGLVPELPPRPPDGTGLPRYGLRWNGPGQPLAVPMADGYWTPWHLAEAEWARCMRERSTDLEAGEAAVRVAKGLRDQRDQTKRDLDRLRAERADLVATYERLRAQRETTEAEFLAGLEFATETVRVLTEECDAAQARVKELESACTPADRAVMVHLVRLIQDSPDVRYYVGWGSQMRELLWAAIKAQPGFEGDPSRVLKPAPHHADDEPRVKRLERELDELRAAARAHLEPNVADRAATRDRLLELL